MVLPILLPDEPFARHPRAVYSRLVEDQGRAAPGGGLSLEADPRAVVRRVGPRLVRDGFGPLVVFFSGWKLIGLTAGIVLAVTFGLAVFVHERRQGRSAAVVKVALAVVFLRAIVGLTSGSASVYLAQEIGIDLLLATTFLGSLALRRPLTAWIAEDVFPFTDEMRRSDVFSRTMATVTAVWGVYFLVRAGVRLVALLTLGTNQYVLVVAATDAPFLIALLVWSVYWTAGAFRRSEQFGPLLAAAAAADPKGAH
jgi:intracellular septation protein A